MKRKPRASRRSLVELNRQMGTSAGSSRPPEFPRSRALCSLEDIERRIRSRRDRFQQGGQVAEDPPRPGRFVRVYDGGEAVKTSPGRISSAASLAPGGPREWDPLPAMAGTAGAGAFEVEAFEHVPVHPSGRSEAPAAPAPVMDFPPPTPAPGGNVEPPFARAPVPVPETTESPAPVDGPAVRWVEDPSEEEIHSDLEALTGQKPPPGPAEPRDPPRPIISTDGGGSGAAVGDEEAVPPSTQQGRPDPHSIFDRMAENLRFASTFDLGSVALEQRLDAFERELDLEESRADASREPVSLELDDLEMAEDLHFLGIGPPEVQASTPPPPRGPAPNEPSAEPTESDSSPGPSPEDKSTEEANRPASPLPDPGEDELARAEGKEP